MASFIQSIRYSVFALFLVCNAIICSVAVWNLSLARAAGLDSQVDIYLAVLGALGVLFILPIFCIDIFRKNALPGRVWFECTWVGVFWMLELAGASAATATLPGLLCASNVKGLTSDACTSSTVLMTFTWLCAFCLLLYLIGLSICAIVHQEDDAKIWHASVRFFPWFGTKARLGSAPPTPTTSQVKGWAKPFRLAHNTPRKTAHSAAFSEVDLEAGGKVEIKGSPVTAPQMRRPAGNSLAVPLPVASAYPAKSQPPAAKSAQLPVGELPRSMQQQRLSRPRKGGVSPIGPPPSQPPPPVPEASSSQLVPPRSAVPPHSSTKPAVSSPLRPKYHRNGSPGGRRPPPAPLDLSKISAYYANDVRRNP